VLAKDEDDSSTDNGILEYSITEGNVGGRFAIDKATGEFFTSNTAVFDVETQDRYTLKVRPAHKTSLC